SKSGSTTRADNWLTPAEPTGMVTVSARISFPSMPCLTIRTGSGIAGDSMLHLTSQRGNLFGHGAQLPVAVASRKFSGHLGVARYRPWRKEPLLFQPTGKGPFSPMLRSRRPSKVFGSLAALLEPIPD